MEKKEIENKVIEEVYKRANVKKNIKVGDSKLKFKIKRIDEFLKESNITN